MVSRALAYHILWVRGLRGHTIPGHGSNLFKRLQRHFRATPFCRQVYSECWDLSVPNARRASPVGAARHLGLRSGLAQNRILSAFCEFSRICKEENFPLSRDADPLFHATGARPRPDTTTCPIVSRPDALPPRRTRASAHNREEVVAAICPLSSITRRLRDPRGETRMIQKP